MQLRLLMVLLLLPALGGWSDHAPSWPHSGPMPDEAIGVSPSHYVPIGAGTKSYRPIDPMPWGDVNKRVAPPAPAEEPPASEPKLKGHDLH